MENDKTRVDKIVVGIINDSAQIPVGWASSETVSVGQGNSIRGDIVNDPAEVKIKAGTPDRQGRTTIKRYNEETFITKVVDSAYLKTFIDFDVVEDSAVSKLTLFGKFSPLVWDSGGPDYGGADYRIITGYQPDPEVPDDVINVRDVEYVPDIAGGGENSKFRLRLASFNPVFLGGEEYNVQFLNWDDSATGFTVLVENPDDFKSRYITEVVAMSVARIPASNYPSAEQPNPDIYNITNGFGARWPDMPAGKPSNTYGLAGARLDYFGEYLPNLNPFNPANLEDSAYRADSDTSEEHRFRINQFTTTGPRLDSANGSPVTPAGGVDWAQTFTFTNTAFVRTDENGAEATYNQVGDEYDDSADTNGFLYTDGQYGSWGGPILYEASYDRQQYSSRTMAKNIRTTYPPPPFNINSADNLFNAYFSGQYDQTDQGSYNFPDKVYNLNYSRPFKLVLKDNTGAVFSTGPFMFAWKCAHLWNTITPCLGKTFLQTYESTTYEVGVAHLTNQNLFQGDAHSPHIQIRDSANDFYAGRPFDGAGNNPQPVTSGQITCAVGNFAGYLWHASAYEDGPAYKSYLGPSNNDVVPVVDGAYVFDSIGPEWIQVDPYENVQNAWSYNHKEQWLPGFERWPDANSSGGTLSNTHNLGTGTWTFAIPCHHNDRGPVDANGNYIWQSLVKNDRLLHHWGLITRPAGIDPAPNIIAGEPPAPPGGALPPPAPNWVSGVSPVGYTRSRGENTSHWQTYIRPAMEAAGTYYWDPSVNGFDFLGASYKNRMRSWYDLSKLYTEFLYPSFWLFGPGDLTTPTNADIVVGDEYRSEVTSLADQTRVFSGYVNNISAAPQAFWFGIKASATQPASFRTGSSPALLSDVTTVTRGVRLGAIPIPNFLYQTEPFTLYGFVLQPGTTYVSIGP